MKRKDTKIEYRTEAEPRAMAGSIPVFCSHDELIPLEKIVPNPKNPNQHSPEQIKLLSEIIKGSGWRAPITISTRSGFITKGHGRLMAAQFMEADVAPVDYQNYASEAEEWADLTADNRIAELSEMDDVKLAEILEDIKEADLDMALSGFSEEEMEKLLEDIADEIIEEAEEEQQEDDSIDVPLSQAGDVWHLGIHTLEVGDGSSEELLVVDTMVGSYIEQTSNISAYCDRDGESIAYMNVVRDWAIRNGREDVLETEKIPIIKAKKSKKKKFQEV